MKIRRALIAVYDKTGIAEFARALVDEFGIEIISTGGTAKHLREAAIPVTLVEDVTGFPEMLDGRVKTLHPKIHAVILADRDKPEHMRQLAEQGIQPLDMVVVNLYPFEQTVAKPDCKFEDALEMIDIGGPCLLRAAAKNHQHVLVVCDPVAYARVLEQMRLGQERVEWREFLGWQAFGAFWKTNEYDAEVSTWLSTALSDDGTPAGRVLRFFNRGRLRYGENPHQTAELLGNLNLASGAPNLVRAGSAFLADERMSLNNYADANTALELCAELTRELTNEPRTEVRGSLPVCVFIKHTNPCGCGVADDPLEAYRRAYLGDPHAAMGGVLACNFEVTTDFATAVVETYDRWGRNAGTGGFFVEVWLAPSFAENATPVIRTRKQWGENVRLLAVGDMSMAPDPRELDYRSIAGGMLVQTRDSVGLHENQWEVVTERKPTEQELADLRLAWLICKHTKSNAVTICRNGVLIGNGAGQMSRVMSCRIATWLAQENGHLPRDARTRPTQDSAHGIQHSDAAVAASDAFFPFRDGPDLLMDADVSALIQPGGSKRDAEAIAACNERGTAMIFTHTRHFIH